MFPVFKFIIREVLATFESPPMSNEVGRSDITLSLVDDSAVVSDVGRDVHSGTVNYTKLSFYAPKLGTSL